MVCLLFIKNIFNNFRQDKVEGPCGSWYNQTYIESLNQPKPNLQSTITANRFASKEDRRRPSRPAVPRRQQVAQDQLPEESLPQQLADLERFGQPKIGKGLKKLKRIKSTSKGQYTFYGITLEGGGGSRLA